MRGYCLLKYFIEGKIEGEITVTVRRGRSGTQLLDDLKETRGYWKLKEEALESTLWITLRWFPRLQVATACFSCRSPDLNFLDP